METIQVNNLTKKYSYYEKEQGLSGSFKNLFHRKKLFNEAVKQVSFSIQEGELVGFIGSNGAGKTTVLKTLSGILYPTSGEVNVLGYQPWKRKNEFLKQISIVMGQKNQLWWDLPAQDTFYLNQRLYSIPNKDFMNRLDYLVEKLEVEEKVNIQVRKLSLGERMKMELIAALLHNPRVLLLDEPTIGLDVKSQKTIRKFIKEYNQQNGNTIILTSHYMKDVQELCNRIIVIDKGNIIFDGNQEDLIKKFSDDKIVNVSFNELPTKEELSTYGEVVDLSDMKASIKVSKSSVTSVVNVLLTSCDIHDISIEETSLEDVVEKII
ncbi:ABC transporter ATP-binding protein [Ruminiclostridium papyrosolvens]|uniref:ABC transporter n=1 Tax=Ruminiclostridium papyrosolvens C7 TaxID=1330534 RepID=U4R100_9FIRM|nr:ATP-binding cassette domain-containing protein [Ruminiclostridium papyrosolvens]EPR10438.1 ABC transporter [Ruminiclostridium papyrosolvens C7]